MINSFETLFEARERKFQQERLFRGESVDLVAKITTDGTLDSLTGYSISGVYQSIDDPEGLTYSVPAEISNGKAILHWTDENDFGKSAYNVWGLLTKDGKAAYPICWRLNFAHSPSYPLSAIDPLVRVIDFENYDLLNAPWIPLSGGVMDLNATIGFPISGDVQNRIGKDGFEKIEETVIETEAMSGWCWHSIPDPVPDYEIQWYSESELANWDVQEQGSLPPDQNPRLRFCATKPAETTTEISSIAKFSLPDETGNRTLATREWTQENAIDKLDDYLPLSGGVISGDFAVSGVLSADSKNVNFGLNNTRSDTSVGNRGTGLIVGNDNIHNNASGMSGKAIDVGFNNQLLQTSDTIVVGNDNKVSGSGINSGTATVVGSRIVASGTAGRQVLYGASLSATGSSYTIGVGYYGTIGSNSVAVANGPNFTKFNVGANAVGIGVGLSSVANNSIAIGYGANTTSQRSIQLGEGTTTSAYQLNVFGKNVLSGSNYTLNRDRIPYLDEYETKADAATEHQTLSTDLTAYVEERIGEIPQPEPPAAAGVLTIKKNETTIVEYNPDSSQNLTATITVPTKVTDLDDNIGIATQTDLLNYATINELNNSFNNARSYTDEQIEALSSTYETKQHTSDTYQTKSDAVADLAFVNGKINDVATDLSTNYLPLSGGNLSGRINLIKTAQVENGICIVISDQGSASTYEAWKGNAISVYIDGISLEEFKNPTAGTVLNGRLEGFKTEEELREYIVQSGYLDPDDEISYVFLPESTVRIVATTVAGGSYGGLYPGNFNGESEFEEELDPDFVYWEMDQLMVQAESNAGFRLMDESDYFAFATLDGQIYVSVSTNSTGGTLTPTPSSITTLTTESTVLDPFVLSSEIESIEESLSNYATKSYVDEISGEVETNRNNLLVATTHINDLSSSLSGTQVQMALYDGRFALPETVIEYYDGTVQLFDLQPTTRSYPNGGKSSAPRHATISSYFESISSINKTGTNIKNIAFGNNVLETINFQPFYDAPEISSDTAKIQTYIGNDLSANVLSSDLKTVADAFSVVKKIIVPNGKRASIPVLANSNYIGYYLDNSFAEINSNINRYQFYGWAYLKEIRWTGSNGALNVVLGSQFINHCPRLELVDLRGVSSFQYDKWTAFDARGRPQNIALPLIIEDANPNLKVIVDDEAYSSLFEPGTWATAIQPYLVKASDWESPHNSDLSAAISSIPSETWTFTLDDDTTITKNVLIG